MIEISASWWPPCFQAIPEGDDIYAYWENDPRVAVIHFLYDINQPYSCSDWGDYGTIDIPLIVNLEVDEDDKFVLDWFENPSSDGLGSLIVFIDHTMTVANIMSSSPSFYIANAIIGNLLNDLPALSNENSSSGVINQFNLTRPYPNPFNPVLNIDFDINQAGLVKVEISDITGAIVNIVYDGYMTMGKHQKSWNSENLPSGVYFVSLQAGGNSLTKKVVLLK